VNGSDRTIEGALLGTICLLSLPPLSGLSPAGVDGVSPLTQGRELLVSVFRCPKGSTLPNGTCQDRIPRASMGRNVAENLARLLALIVLTRPSNGTGRYVRRTEIRNEPSASPSEEPPREMKGNDRRFRIPKALQPPRQGSQRQGKVAHRAFPDYAKEPPHTRRVGRRPTRLRSSCILLRI
jgi:hypothetical protein